MLIILTNRTKQLIRGYCKYTKDKEYIDKIIFKKRVKIKTMLGIKKLFCFTFFAPELFFIYFSGNSPKEPEKMFMSIEAYNKIKKLNLMTVNDIRNYFKKGISEIVKL